MVGSGVQAGHTGKIRGDDEPALREDSDAQAAAASGG